MRIIVRRQAETHIACQCLCLVYTHKNTTLHFIFNERENIYEYCASYACCTTLNFFEKAKKQFGIVYLQFGKLPLLETAQAEQCRVIVEGVRLRLL